MIAVGYSMVFGILRLINFLTVQYMLLAYMVYFFVSLHIGLFPSILLSIVLSGLLALLIDKVALEPLRKKNSIRIATLITTIGVSYVIQNVLSMEKVFTSENKGFPSLNLFPNLFIGNLTIQSSQLIMFFVALILLVVLTTVVNKTKIGLAMRATEQNMKAAP